MTESVELRERLTAALEGAEPSDDLGSRISARVDQRERRRRSTRVAGSALALLVVVAGAALVVTGGRDDRQVLAGDPSVLRWEVLADPPVAAREGPAGVWTGTEVIFWGGGGGSDSRAGLRADGAAFDPATDSWRTLPDAPIGARGGHTGVWTGTELIVWGGWRPDGEEPPAYADGAAYDPATDSWRVIADSPLGPRLQVGAVWTGQEMVVIGGMPAGPDAGSIGAAYDPATDRWRLLPEIDDLTGNTAAWAAWTGEEVLYWRANSEVLDGMAGGPGLFSYRPDDDTWTRRRSPTGFELAWGDAAVAWTGRKLVVASGTTAGSGDWWGDAEAIAYDLASDQWERIILTPNVGNGLVTPRAGAPDALWTGREIIAVEPLGSTASVLDPATAEWDLLPDLPAGLDWATLVATDAGDVYLWGASTVARLTRAPEPPPVGGVDGPRVRATDFWREATPGVTAETLADGLRCGNTAELDQMNAPIRGGAATRGISCSVGEAEVHIFQRAPTGESNASEPYAREGGSLANIDRVMGTADGQAGCLYLLVGPTWFIVANDTEVVTTAADTFGGADRPIVSGTPEASYIGPGGCGSG